MEAKFTKGPWELVNTVETGRLNIFGAGYHVGTLVSGSAKDLGIFKDNARLIVTAPELYDAASNILPDIEYEIDQRKYGGNDENWRDLEKKASTLRAALAKARGESQA